jgi:hypothetical protein
MEDYENDINTRCWSHDYGIENETEEWEEDITSAKNLIQKVLQLYGVELHRILSAISRILRR